MDSLNYQFLKFFIGFLKGELQSKSHNVPRPSRRRAVKLSCTADSIADARAFSELAGDNKAQAHITCRSCLPHPVAWLDVFLQEVQMTLSGLYGTRLTSYSGLSSAKLPFLERFNMWEGRSKALLTFMSCIDDKLFLLEEAPCVNELRLTSGDHDHSATLLKRPNKGMPGYLVYI